MVRLKRESVAILFDRCAKLALRREGGSQLIMEVGVKWVDSQTLGSGDSSISVIAEPDRTGGQLRVSRRMVGRLKRSFAQRLDRLAVAGIYCQGDCGLDKRSEIFRSLPQRFRRFSFGSLVIT